MMHGVRGGGYSVSVVECRPVIRRGQVSMNARGHSGVDDVVRLWGRSRGTEGHQQHRRCRYYRYCRRHQNATDMMPSARLQTPLAQH